MGLNRETGRMLSGWPHVVQSLGVIWSTRLNEREMRGWFGGELADALGKPLVPGLALTVAQKVTVATELWEPRFAVIRARFMAIGRDGKTALRIDGEYRPKGHLGDLTPEGVRTIVLGPSGVEAVA